MPKGPRLQAAVAGGVALVPWAALALMARGLVPGSLEAVDRLFPYAIAWSYAGLWAFALVATRSRKRMLLRAMATTLVAALLLLLLELPAALGALHWTILFRRVSGEGRDYGTAYVYDAELSFRRIPGLHWSGRPASDVEEGSGLPRSAERPIRFTYDRWGYRNAREMPQADVVLLGDSYVEGWYVSDDETVASRLSERLGRPVANLGVAGYGTLQTLRVLRGDAMARRPRTAVWFFFEGNDLYDDQHFENWLLADEPPTVEESTPHPEGLAAAHGWRERSFIRNALRYLRRWAHPLLPNQPPYWARLPGRSGREARVYFADYGAVPWTEYEEERWAVARASLEAGWDFAQSRGLELVFVYVPVKYRVFRGVIEVPPGSPLESWGVWSELPEHFAELCRTTGAPCLDLTGALQRAVGEGRMVYARTDTHWSAEGHALAARELAQLLVEGPRGLGPLAGLRGRGPPSPPATSEAETRQQVTGWSAVPDAGCGH